MTSEHPVPRCRHHTDPKGLDGIKKDNAIDPARGEPVGVHVEVEPFGSARPYPRYFGPAAQTGAKGGSAYVEFDLPRNAIPTRVGARNTAVIPTDQPLSLAGRHPVFVRLKWWQFWKW